jgi:flagellar biogenesis protein FliO
MSSSFPTATKFQSPAATQNTSQLLGCPNLWRRFQAFSRSFLGRIVLQRNKRHLQLCETLSLGEKRILAIVKVENQRFLIAATGQEIALLQRLPDACSNLASSSASRSGDCKEGLL